MSDAAADQTTPPPAPHIAIRQAEGESEAGVVLGDCALEPVRKGKEGYRLTSRGGKIAKTAVLCGLKRITMKENCIVREECLIRADLATVYVGAYCLLGTRSVIRPFPKPRKGTVSYYPIKIGNYVSIGSNSHINSSVPNFALIGDDCVVGRHCSIRSCVVIDNDSVVPPYTTIPPFTRWRGNPAVMVEQLHEGAQQEIKLSCEMMYDSLLIEE